MRSATYLPLLAGLIILASVAIYWPGLAGPLLFDDKSALTDNEAVKIDGDSFDEWRVAAFSSNSGPLRRPIAMMSFAANHVVAGNFSPTGLKAVNLAVHLSISVLLYLFFNVVLDALGIVRDRYTRQMLAVTASAIWLLHPLNVSTVLYAVQRMAQWASFFVISGLLVFMRYRMSWRETGASFGECLAAALWLLLFTVLAALSKENGALLPWLVIVLEVCIFRGVWAGHPNTWLRGAGWILLFIPLVAVVSVLLIAPERLTAVFAGREFTLEERLLTQGRLLWRYLGWICLPNINDMGFQHDDIPISTGLFQPLTTFLSLLAWVVLLVLSFLLRGRFPLLLLAVLFFLVGHSMESTILPLEMVYEHRNYLPAMMIYLLLASVLVLPAARSQRVEVWLPATGALVVLSLLLLLRVQTWSDELTLSRSNLAQHPESSRSNYFYANALLRHFRRSEERGLSERERSESLLLSRHYFERMYQTNERDVAALVMLFYLDGQYFTELQQQVDWLAKLDELLDTRRLQPSDWNALSMLFDIFSSEGNFADDLRINGLLDKLADRYPDSAEVLRYRYRYQVYRKADSAILLATLDQARELTPESPWVYYYLLYENARAQNVAGLYESARLSLKHDRHRYRVRQLKGMFVTTENPPNSIHD
jgi:protein O-mannosyl-transferase